MGNHNYFDLCKVQKYVSCAMCIRKSIFSTTVACAGVVSMCLGFVASAIGGTVIQMAVTFASACGGPTMSMFLLGVFFPFVNWKVSPLVFSSSPP